MSDLPLPDVLTELRQWSKEHRRNEVARILAALDLLRDDQITIWVARVEIKVAYTRDRKELLELIRRELVK
ncbi:MAG: hypothetical protein ACRDYA_21920 [Egibacteraceae bacterium]